MTWINGMAFYNCSGLTSACFTGDAPLMTELNVFDSTAIGFKVYYLNGKADFTTPTWQGYPAFPGAPPQFTGATPPAIGKYGITYSYTCTAAGTPAPTFTITSGALPAGLTIDSAGSISGIPTVEGIFTGTITAANGFASDVTQDFAIDTRLYRTLVAGGPHGAVTGGGSCPFDSTVMLTACPDDGYVFAGWSGDATGNNNPLSVLVNADKTITATFVPDADNDGISDNDELTVYHTNPNLADSDADGLSDYAEIFTHHTNPTVPDTDSDGFLDGYEVLTGKSPTDPLDMPALVAEARTAIEFTFPSALGKTYRIEGSLDLDTWTPVESGIAGNGGVVRRFYSTRNAPQRFLRVEEVVP